MKLPALRRINKEELAKGGELPKWLDSLLTPLNVLIEQVGSALDKRLTFSENFLSNTLELKFTHLVEREVNPAPQNLRSRVVGIVPLFSQDDAITSFQWIQKQNGNVGMSFGFLAGGVKESTVRFLVVLG